MVDKRVLILYDTFTTNICLAANVLPYSIDQMNDVMFYNENNKDLTIPNVDLRPLYTDQRIADTYINIIKYCLHIIKQAKNVADPYLYEEACTTIPIIIFKSFEILINYPTEYKIVPALCDVFVIPLCYLSTIDARPLIITPY